MVLAWHLIFGAYGFWLPNDPRGSWSTRVEAPHLRPFGPATKVNTTQSLAHRQHDRRQRFTAKAALKYPAVQFDAEQRRAIGEGVAELTCELQLTVHACAVMPDHLHFVIARHPIVSEQLAGMLKRAATRALNAHELHPLARYAKPNGRTPSPWVKGQWVVYLNTPQDVQSRIRYVQRNPTESGLPAQSWRFVTPYTV